MMRIGLFLITNIAVLALLSIVMKIFGLDYYLKANGGIDLTSLLVLCAVMGMGGSFISLFMSKWLAKRSSGTQLIEQPSTADEKWLVDTVAELAQKAGIKMPEVGIFPSGQPNAFATGWNKNDALVAVSAGMFERFPKNEVRAVMAHEIGHVANGDMVTLALVQGVMNTFVMFFARIIGYVVDRAVFKNERGHGPGHFIVVMVAQVVLGFLASIVVAWFSRFREYRADYAGATLADKQSMMAALARLQGETLAMQQARVENDMPDTLVAFGISGFKDNFASLFSTHPPIDDRIAQIQKI